jgi:hypothetical protein
LDCLLEHFFCLILVINTVFAIAVNEEHIAVCLAARLWLELEPETDFAWPIGQPIHQTAHSRSHRSRRHQDEQRIATSCLVRSDPGGIQGMMR